MEAASLDEENLREAAAVGNVDKVEALIRQGVNVNSRNSMNGWWAPKHCTLSDRKYSQKPREIQKFLKSLF